MMKAWATFAKDPHKRYNKLAWVIFDPGDNALVCLDFGNTTALNLRGSVEYDAGYPSTFPV